MDWLNRALSFGGQQEILWMSKFFKDLISSIGTPLFEFLHA
jgi:hypothetical protein